MLKKILCILLPVAAIAAIIAFRAEQLSPPVKKELERSAAFKPVSLIELFTSQGCSSCPSADRLLAKTISAADKDGRNILAISFHVDYWNRLGWVDAFSTKEYSERQRQYAAHLNLNSVYTPQMVVNGSKEFVGSDENRLKEELTRSLSVQPKAGFRLLKININTNAIPTVSFALEGDYSASRINFALVSLSETTPVKGGENGGRTLTSGNVVRQFFSIPATDTGLISFKETPVPPRNNMAVVAYIQQTNDLKITGAAKADLR